MKLISALLITVMLASTASCAWLKSEGSKAQAAAVDCAKQDLGQTVADAGVSLLMAVVAILAAGGSDWRADLTALETKYGADAVACAVKIGESLFRPAPDAVPLPGYRLSDAHDRAVQALVGKTFR